MEITRVENAGGVCKDGKRRSGLQGWKTHACVIITLKGVCSRSPDLFQFREIIDNISESKQDRHAATED